MVNQRAKLNSRAALSICEEKERKEIVIAIQILTKTIIQKGIVNTL